MIMSRPLSRTWGARVQAGIRTRKVKVSGAEAEERTRFSLTPSGVTWQDRSVSPLTPVKVTVSPTGWARLVVVACVVSVVAAWLVVALAIALTLNRKIALRGLFRTAFFLPVVVSGVVVTILWQNLYSFDSGVLNSLLNVFGIPKVPWLIDPGLAMPSIAIMATWKNVGIYIVLFLVGLQNIPKEIYESASLDGADKYSQFFKITLPMLNSTMVLIVALSTIGGFSLFIEPYVLTGGGPMQSTMSGMLYIYNQAFYFGHMGYAAALGFVFALVILLVVLLQRKVVEAEPS